MASQSENIAVLKKDLEWLSKVGWTIAGIYAVIFTGFLTWYLPKELTETKDKAVSEVKVEIN